MATVRTCKTPEEGWSLFNHFFGNSLPVIQGLKDPFAEEDEIGKRLRERELNDVLAKLIGNLYLITRRILKHGHHDDAAKMLQIVEFVAEQDLTDLEVCKALEELRMELSEAYRTFKSEMTNLRNKHN